MLRFLILFVFLSAQNLLAENPGQQQKPVNPNAIQVIDDKFFDAKAPEKAAPNPATNSDGRYYGEEPNYNTEQRAQWLETCAPKKEKDPEGYKKCYLEEKKRTLSGIKQTYDSVEKRQAEPLRNANPLLEEQQRKNTFDD